MESYYTQNNFDGGLSDSLIRGVKGSISEGVGIDIRSEPGVLKVSQALSKESVAVVVDFARFAVNATDGNSYWGGDTGHFYKRTSGGAWSDLFTNANGAIIGMEEYNDYIYYASATKLGRYGPLSGAATNSDSWQTLTTSTWHPMAVNGLYLFIGNARQIASVSEVGTFTANGTPDVTLGRLPVSHNVSAMTNFGIDIIVGTTVSSTFSSARIFRWDTASPAYISTDDIPEIGINCFIQVENFTYAQAGTQGMIYFYDGAELNKKKKIRGNYSNKTMACNPGSTCKFRGVALFGVSNLSGNPCNQGIYSLSQYDANYPVSLMLEYIPSPNKLTSMEVGALLSVGNTLLVAWKDGATYGVDAINWSLKYASAYFTTLVLGGNREVSKTFEESVIGYKSKPTGTDITLSYYPNYSSSDTAVTLRDETDYNKLFSKSSFEASVAMFKLVFTTSVNLAPEIDSLYFKWNSRETL